MLRRFWRASAILAEVILRRSDYSSAIGLLKCDLVLISRDGWVDLDAPCIDSAVHVLGVFEPLLSQILGHLHAASTVMAVNDDSFFAVRLQFGQSLGRLVHRNQARSVDAAVVVFVLLAAID